MLLDKLVSSVFTSGICHFENTDICFKSIPHPRVIVIKNMDYRNISQYCNYRSCNIMMLIGWLVVFNVPSTARSFRDGTPHLLSLAKDVKVGF